MEPTDALRLELRRALDEVIPEGGTDADTRFSDEEIDELLRAFTSIAAAAAEGWARKALRAMSERGGLQKMQAGSERFEFVSIESYRDHCLLMAQTWSDQIPGQGSARLLGIVEPNVLGPTDPTRTDLSRLIACVEV
jgi:hypothetical protein